eukprot:1792691-Amphidinium_carterae.1
MMVRHLCTLQPDFAVRQTGPSRHTLRTQGKRWREHDGPDPARARKSTSSTLAHFGQHYLEAGCSLQRTHTHRHALALFIRSQRRRSDRAPAFPRGGGNSLDTGRGIAARLGVGRVGHIALRDGDFAITRIPTEYEAADLCTKYVNRERIELWSNWQD